MDIASQGSVLSADGVRGTFELLRVPDGQSQSLVRVMFPEIPALIIPTTLLLPGSDNTYQVALSAKELAHAGNIAAVVPVVQEQVHVDKAQVTSGGVRISKHVVTETEVIDEPLFKEEVEIEHRPINRIIDTPVNIRQEGDATIIPLYDETLVVEKRLLLREELVIRKRRTEVHEPQTVTRRHEEVDIQDLSTELGDKKELPVSPKSEPAKKSTRKA